MVLLTLVASRSRTTSAVTSAPVRWAVAHALPGRPGTVAELLDELREAGAQEQAAALTDRLPGAGLFELLRKQENPPRIGSGSAGTPMGAQPGYGDGKIWLTWPGLVIRDPGQCP